MDSCRVCNHYLRVALADIIVSGHIQAVDRTMGYRLVAHTVRRRATSRAAAPFMGC